MSPHDLPPGSPVILYLANPREKVWGLLLALQPAGVTVRGLDISVFEDWMRQEARGEDTGLGLSTLFYPMHRLERMERDETLGPIESYNDRFRRIVGLSVLEVAGIQPPETGTES
jgi:hypothetical protein